MSSKAKKNTTTTKRETRIPISRFVDGTFVKIDGTLTYKNDLDDLEPSDKINGTYEVEVDRRRSYDLSTTNVLVTLKNIVDPYDEFCFDSGEFVTASTFVRVKPRTLYLNDEFDVQVFPGGYIRVGCQDIAAKHAEKAALAILTACGYTFS